MTLQCERHRKKRRIHGSVLLEHSVEYCTLDKRELSEIGLLVGWQCYRPRKDERSDSPSLNR